MAKPSVQDVARVAGVGTSTVSRVLNGRSNISERTRQRVLAAIETVGYTPDLNARSFRLGQTRAVSVLLPVTGTAFYERLIGAIYARLAEEEYDVALFPLLGAHRTRRFRDSGALVYRADGLLIASQNPDELYGGRPPFNKPIVLVDGHHPHYHSVSFDNLAAGRLAAELALSQRLPIVLLDGVEPPEGFDSPIFLERRTGVTQTLARHGVTPLLTLRVPTSLRGTAAAAEQLLAQGAQPPFFLLAYSDDIALGVQRQLQHRGLEVARDYLMLGFDGSAAAAEAGISSVAQPVEDMGHTAAELLLQAMRGQLKTTVQRVFPPMLRGAPGTTLRPSPARP